jgi:hypothetical protein
MKIQRYVFAGSPTEYVLSTDHETAIAILSEQYASYREAAGAAIGADLNQQAIERITQLEEENRAVHKVALGRYVRIRDLEATLRWTLSVIDPGAGPQFEKAYVQAQHALAGTQSETKGEQT